MKARDIRERLTAAIFRLPASRRGLAAAAVAAGAFGAALGLVWPRPAPSLAPGAENTRLASQYTDEDAPAKPNREAKGALEASPSAALGRVASVAPPEPGAAQGAQLGFAPAAAPPGAPASAPLPNGPPAAVALAPPPAEAAAPPSPPGRAPAAAAEPPPSVTGAEQRLAHAAPEAAAMRTNGPPADPREIAAALAPVIARQPSPEDAEAVKELARLVYKEDFAAARALLSRIGGKSAKKLAYWYFLRGANSQASAAEIAAFRHANPLWPNRELLDERGERALFLQSAPWRETLGYFNGRRPVSGPGKSALGAALVAKGEKEQGLRLIREVWRQQALDEDMEAKLFERFGAHLSEGDHKQRADFLTFKAKRSKVEAVARFQRKPSKAAPKSLPAQLSAARSPARLLARIQLLRRQSKHQEAWALLRSKEAGGGLAAADWWAERRLEARIALNEGHPKIAYAIVQGHGPLDSEAQAEAEFLAGWLALRFINDPKLARQHLTAAVHAGGLPKDRARSLYWLARAELALANRAGAQAHFTEAARHQHTFYGQLAWATLAQGAPRVSLRPPLRPTAEDIRNFQSRDVVEAVLVAQKSGLEPLVPVFLNDLARTLDSPGELTLLAEFALRVAPQHATVRFAKIALNRGFALEQYAYPAALPQFRPLVDAGRLDRALLHALTRQESEFNADIVSSANARGLMQLLPGTAKQMCQAYGVKFEVGRLISDPAYNVSLGSAYLYKVLDEYSGSYIMALASYNAGPGRVREWIGKFGDPRDPKMDPVDWIERIPFTETREYVQKILESVQLYRAKLGGRDGPMLLVEDLHRGRPAGATGRAAGARN